MDTASPNRFFLWTLGERTAREFRPEEVCRGGADTDVRYFAGIALELDRALPERGLTYLVTWHLDAFEDRFRDAVVILVGDEKHQVPSYAPCVRAVFRTGGCRPNPFTATLGLAPAVAWRVALRDARNRLLARRRGPGGTRAGRRATQPELQAPAFELPMGYFGLVDVPFVPFEAREVDVFFAGSVETGAGFTVRPRLAARRQMTAALTAALARLPGLAVEYASSGPFANPERMLGPVEYSTALMQAKIALCPRGNFDETFRLGEAARSGCIAIVERLPERWYHRDSPAVELSRWAALPAALEQLLSDPDGLAARSERMRRWWSERLSETAAARYMVAALATLETGSPVVAAPVAARS